MDLGGWLRSVSFAVALTTALGGFAHADGDGDHGGNGDSEGRHEAAERASRGARSGELVPLASIMANVRTRYAGEIVETEFESKAGRPYYEFHLLDQTGRVTEVRVDARSGRFLDGEADDD
jgi:uncharacterized membrane protein YkoI